MPCDLLILDSDEKDLSNYVVTIETTANDGISEITMKTALSGTKVISNNRYQDMTKGNFTDYRKKLSGTISYTKPTVAYKNFEAFVQLKNDPKIEKATFKNLIVKGSVLKSGWLIGLALYVGYSCKVDSKQVHYSMNSKSNLEKRIQKLTFHSIFTYIGFVILSRISQGIYVEEGSV